MDGSTLKDIWGHKLDTICQICKYMKLGGEGGKDVADRRRDLNSIKIHCMKFTK